MIKAVMIDGPKSGEVVWNDAGFSDVLCFPIARPTDWLSAQTTFDPYAPLYDTAVYRHRGRVVWPGNAIDVFTFDGMQ